MAKYIKFIDKINSLVKYIVSILFIVMVILVALQVLTRFVIDYPISWSEEVGRYLMVYIVFLGSGLLVRKNGHIAIDFLLEIINLDNRKRLEFVNLAISTIFFLILIYSGIQLTMVVLGQATPTLQFSMAWAYAAMPIGSILMLLNALAVFFEMTIDGENTKEEEII